MATDKRFIFIAGAEGSGTTLLLRLLSAPAECAGLGGNFLKLPDDPEAAAPVEAFNAANFRLWDRKASRAVHEAARAEWHAGMQDILRSPVFAGCTRFIFKRSFPFGGERDRYTPDLWDVLALLPQARVVVIYRNPCAATFSVLRRGFDGDLRRLAVACCEQLTWLAGQVRAVGPEPVSVVSYRRLCSDPAGTLAALCNACNLPVADVIAAAEAEGIDTAADRRYGRELDPVEASWLENFFEIRRRQWEILAAEP